VQNPQAILDSLKAAEVADIEWLVFYLDASSDGVAEITETLDGVTELSNIHIVSEGLHSIQLGSVTLDIAAHDHYAKVISQWGESLSAKTDAQVLIHSGQMLSDTGGRLQTVAALEIDNTLTVDDLPAENATNADRIIQSVEDTDGDKNESLPQSRTEVVFIDSNTPDSHLFLQDITARVSENVTVGCSLSIRLHR